MRAFEMITSYKFSRSFEMLTKYAASQSFKSINFERYSITPSTLCNDAASECEQHQIEFKRPADLYNIAILAFFVTEMFKFKSANVSITCYAIELSLTIHEFTHRMSLCLFTGYFMHIYTYQASYACKVTKLCAITLQSYYICNLSGRCFCTMHSLIYKCTLLTNIESFS